MFNINNVIEENWNNKVGIYNEIGYCFLLCDLIFIFYGEWCWIFKDVMLDLVF